MWCCEGGWYEEVLSKGGVGGGAVCNEGREGRRYMIEGNMVVLREKGNGRQTDSLL